MSGEGEQQTQEGGETTEQKVRLSPDTEHQDQSQTHP